MSVAITIFPDKFVLPEGTSKSVEAAVKSKELVAEMCDPTPVECGYRRILHFYDAQKDDLPIDPANYKKLEELKKKIDQLQVIINTYQPPRTICGYEVSAKTFLCCRASFTVICAVVSGILFALSDKTAVGDHPTDTQVGLYSAGRGATYMTTAYSGVSLVRDFQRQAEWEKTKRKAKKELTEANAAVKAILLTEKEKFSQFGKECIRHFVSYNPKRRGALRRTGKLSDDEVIQQIAKNLYLQQTICEKWETSLKEMQMRLKDVLTLDQMNDMFAPFNDAMRLIWSAFQKSKVKIKDFENSQRLFYMNEVQWQTERDDSRLHPEAQYLSTKELAEQRQLKAEKQKQDREAAAAARAETQRKAKETGDARKTESKKTENGTNDHKHKSDKKTTRASRRILASSSDTTTTSSTSSPAARVATTVTSPASAVLPSSPTLSVTPPNAATSTSSSSSPSATTTAASSASVTAIVNSSTSQTSSGSNNTVQSVRTLTLTANANANSRSGRSPSPNGRGRKTTDVQAPPPNLNTRANTLTPLSPRTKRGT